MSPTSQEKIAKALSDLKGTSTFAHKQVVEEYPQPIITVNGIRELKLPLSEDDVLALTKVCHKPVASEKVWELEGKMVTINKSAWIKGTILEGVCMHLGTQNPHWSTRRIVISMLRKLLVYGAHTRPTYEVALPPRTRDIHTRFNPRSAFARLVLVLPSDFTGGSVRLTFDGNTKEFPILDHNAITAFAWYKQVTHEAEMVTAGFQVALIFDILLEQPVRHLPEKLEYPITSTAPDRLKSALQDWKKHGEKCVYWLNGRYEPGTLRHDGLDKSDRNIIYALQPIAEEAGIEFCLAEIEFLERDTVDIEEIVHEARFGGCASDDEPSDLDGVASNDPIFEEVIKELNPDDFDIEPHEIGVDVLSAFDMNGVPVEIDGLKFSIGWDCDSWEDNIINGHLGNEPCEKSFETTANRMELILRRAYLRHALILWPAGKYKLKVDVRALAGSKSALPTPEERELFKLLATGCVRYPASTQDFSRLLSAALQWHDVSLLLQAMEVIGGATGFDNDELLAALHAFEFSPIQDVIKQKLHSGVGNHFKLDFLSQLELCATSAEKKLVRVWCEAERSSLLQNLCVPYVQDAHLFIHLTKERGVKYLKETIFPQLLKLSPGSDFWISFATKLAELEKASVQVSDETSVAFIAAVRALDSLSVDDTKFLWKVAKLRGVHFVVESMLPQISRPLINHSSWCSFIAFLHDMRHEIPPNVEAVSTAVSKMIDATITAAPEISSMPVDPEALGERQSMEETPATTIKQILRYVHLCTLAEHNFGLVKLFDQVETGFSNAAANDASRAVRLYYIPLVEKLQSLVNADSEVRAKLSHTISKLLSTAVEKIPAFPKGPSSGFIRAIGSKEFDYSPDITSVLKVIELCRARDDLPSCKILVDRMVKTFDQADSDQKQEIALFWYLSLLIKLNDLQLSREEPWRSLYITAGQNFTAFLPAMFGPGATCHGLTKDSMEVVIKMLLSGPWVSHIEFGGKLQCWLQLAESDQQYMIDNLQNFILFHKEALIGSGAPGPLLANIVTICAIRTIDNATIDPLPSLPASTITTPLNNPLQGLKFNKLLELVETYSRSKDPGILSRLLNRFLETPKDTPPTEWIRYLMLFVPALKNKKPSLNHDLELPAFSSFCAAIARRFLEVVLATPETSALPYLLSQVGCSCCHCAVLRRFVLGTECSLTVTSPDVDHMTNALKHVHNHWGLQWKRRGKDQLDLSKPANLRSRVFSANVQTGKNFLDRLGNQDRQRKILGEAYNLLQAAFRSRIYQTQQHRRDQNNKRKRPAGPQMNHPLPKKPRY